MEQALMEKDQELEGEGAIVVKTRKKTIVQAVVDDVLVEVFFVKTEETKMPRPCKQRRVRGRPNSSYFKPAGVRISELEESSLKADEFEAIRLKDVLELDQNSCAEKMEVSQPTFHRLLSSARKKIADAIVNGKAIKIED